MRHRRMSWGSSGRMVREVRQALDGRQVFEITRDVDSNGIPLPSSHTAVGWALELGLVSSWFGATYGVQSFSGRKAGAPLKREPQYTITFVGSTFLRPKGRSPIEAR